MNWRKAYIGMIIIVFSAFIFAFVVSRSNPSISAVYARIAGFEEYSVPPVPPPVVIKGPLRHESIESQSLKAFPFESGFLQSNTVARPDNFDQTIQPSAIIYAVASSAPGFAALEKMPLKTEPKPDKDEISPEEIKIPSSYISGEKAKIGGEYSILVEE